MMRSESHVIGMTMREAEFQIDAGQVDFMYRTVRLMLAGAFIEAPGAALVAFVSLLFTMRSHADRVHLSDNELATSLRSEAHEIGTTCGNFVKTLPDLERERLLRSIPGDNFLRFAAESSCRKICFAPAITQHISLRWSGELLFVLGNRQGIYQWGGRFPLRTKQVWLLRCVVPLAWLANILLLPVVAVYPPFAEACREFADSLGVEGVDSRDSPGRPEGKPGYSNSMALWWRSLVLFDVPLFKFVLSQAGSLGLLGLMMYIGPCFDFNNHQACFPEHAVWHMIGDGSGVMGAMLRMLGFDLTAAVQDPLEGMGTSDGGSGLSTAAIRRALKGKARMSVRNDDGASSTTFGVVQTPDFFGFSKNAVYLVLLVYSGSLLASSLHTRPSIASAHTYASVGAAACTLIYLIVDLAILYPLDASYDIQPLALSLATFLLWMDVARAVLLKTYLCGPSVLMLMLMFQDVGVFLILAITVAVGFALALFFNNILASNEPTRPDCPLSQGHFYSYSLVLVEDLLGMSTVSEQVGCAKESKDYISTVVLELYLVVGTILLLNMLIAMMGETFADVRSRQEEEYNFLNSRIVISVDLEQGNVPPPLSFMRVPWLIFQRLQQLRRLLPSSSSKPTYHSLEDQTRRFSLLGSGGEGGAVAAMAAATEATTNAATNAATYQGKFTHVSPQDLIDVLDEVDQTSEDDDLPGLIRGMKQALLTELGMDFAKLKETLAISVGGAAAAGVGAPATTSRGEDVVMYDGYYEEASRLVFHYSDHFQDLPSAPLQRTFLPSGVSENEPKLLPIKIEDEAPDKAKNEPDMTRDE